MHSHEQRLRPYQRTRARIHCLTPPSLHASSKHRELQQALRSNLRDGDTLSTCTRTKRRSRISRTCRQPFSLPGRSARRLQAHNCTRTARDGSFSGMAWERAVEAPELRFARDTPVQHGPAPTGSMQCSPPASLGVVGGGERHQSGVPSQLTANLADPAESCVTRITTHEAWSVLPR